MIMSDVEYCSQPVYLSPQLMKVLKSAISSTESFSCFASWQVQAPLHR